MPGLVVFKRRWSAGSDDLVVPAAILLIIHILCLIMVIISLTRIDYNNASAISTKAILYHLFGYIIILSLSICIEVAICIISMKGSILDIEKRTSINAWIYAKSVILLVDVLWLILGSWVLINYYRSDAVERIRKLFLGILLTNWVLVMVTIITVWCTFDLAGRSWVKMKNYQKSMRESESRLNYRRSNSVNRNWRQRKVMRAYQDSWNQRCRLLFCCIGSTERSRNSFTDIARLLSDFFRELDVVPSDIVAGLVLLRKFQRLEREAIVRQRKNGTYEFLSGVPITERTQFLALNDPASYDFFQTVIHYMYFAQGAYGWPMYLYQRRFRIHHLLTEMRCFTCCRSRNNDNEVQIIQDNCCYCNYAALKKTLLVGDVEIIYVTYHVDVGETPFFVAVDYSQKKIVITIRGTLSMKDVLTDLNAESEVLPLNPPRDDWLGHKGMVQAAIYIRNKLYEEELIERALNKDRSRNTHTFDLVFVGHSLGAGTAAILAVLMKPNYPTLQCFSYSPPGGLLSMPVVEYSKSFITSVVLGKDVIPRIGLHQMEALRSDLINAIQRSVDPKWKTISCSIVCCGCGPEPKSVIEMSAKDSDINKYQEERDSARLTSTHPADSSIALTIHQPLYPPGRIIHIVRHHPKPDEQKYERSWRNMVKRREPVYQAIWADTIDFDEVLISPVMLQDHMPDEVLSALKKVANASGPRKPHRQISNATNNVSFHTIKLDGINNVPNDDYNGDAVDDNNVNNTANSDDKHIGPLSTKPKAATSFLNVQNCDVDVNLLQSNVFLETSFANLNSPILNKKFQHKNPKVDEDGTGDRRISTTNVSQYNTVKRDSSSELNDSITTITQKTYTTPFMVSTLASDETAQKGSFTITRNAKDKRHQELKSVAFDINGCIRSNRDSKKFERDGFLQRQSSARLPIRTGQSLKMTPPQKRRASIAPNHLDLTYDEWFDFAPLASPETLSEISSISSRNSIRNNCAINIERNLLHSSNNNNNNNNNTNNINKLYTKSVLDNIYESQLHTPTVLRRAPKFTENLSTCAEDSRNLDQYKRMSCVRVKHLTNETQPLNSSDTNGEETEDNENDNNDDSDTDSFETATSFKLPNRIARIHKRINTHIFNSNERENSKSADELDELIQMNLPIQEPKLACSDSHILQDDGSQCTNKMNATDVLMKSDNCLTGSDDITYYSANSSIERVTCSTQTNIIEGLLESHFPIEQQYQHHQHQFISIYEDALTNLKNPKIPVIKPIEINYSQLVQNSGKFSKNLSPTGRKWKASVYPLATPTTTAITTETITTRPTTTKSGTILSMPKFKGIVSSSETSTEEQRRLVVSNQSIINNPASGYTFTSLNESRV